MGSEQKRALIAVVLSGIVLFGWQKYFAPPAPVVENNPQVVTPSVEAPTKITTKPSVAPQVVEAKKEVALEAVASSVTLTNQVHQVTINGNLEIENFSTSLAIFPFEDVVGDLFRLQILGTDKTGEKSIYFTSLKKLRENEVEATTNIEGLTARLALLDSGLLSMNFSAATPLRYSVKMTSSEAQLDGGQIRKFKLFTKEIVDLDLTDTDVNLGKVQWFGIDFNYHLFGIVSPEKLQTKFTTNGKDTLIVDDQELSATRNFKLVFSKKNYDQLIALGDNLRHSVEFGFFDIIAVPILRGLQFFYKYIPNYGVSIILLTLIIRLITFPLQYKSFKSMKKMQKVQPELAKLKEKFKDDPQRMQRETMELFKRSGANPLGGCLPLFLQMPIFFAFYKVLSAAVELVGAPFFGWITDLSVKDPYFILPVLMAAVMFVQQKLTPSASADPTQQKVMMFMPLIFGFIMKDLPAGLVLYIFVSTLFGITQQLFVYRTTD